MKSTTSSPIIGAMKPVFARHGILEMLIRTTVCLSRIPEFSTKYNYGHVTSSPYFAQSNRQAEHTVQTVKKLLKDFPDHDLLTNSGSLYSSGAKAGPLSGSLYSSGAKAGPLSGSLYSSGAKA